MAGRLFVRALFVRVGGWNGAAIYVKASYMSWSGPTEGGSGRRGYHHGNLREALIEAALELVGAKGPAGFTIAEAARLAGVSPAAPYRHFRDAEALLAEVEVAGVVADQAAPLRRYDPGHPDADADGYVSFPDINPATEMVDLMGATRSYQLNATAVTAEKNMLQSSIDLMKS